MKIRVLNPFYDLETNENRLVGDEIEITKERFEQLKNNLPYGYFEVLTEEKSKKKK